MKWTFSGWAGKIVSWIATIAVMVVFTAGGLFVGITRPLLAPVVLAVLLAGFYFILSDRQLAQYPKHSHATAGMLAGAYILMAAAGVGEEQLVSIPGFFMALGIAMVIGFGVWKDYKLGDMELNEDITIEIGETDSQ